MTTVKNVFALAAAVLLQGAVAGAQTPDRIEIWGALSGNVDAASGTLTSSYTPPLLLSTAVTSSGTQTLALNGSRGPGFEAGAAYFPTPVFGLRVSIDRSTVDLTGTNGPYSVSLQYIARQPPDNIPQTYTAQSSTPWPETSGSLTEQSVTFDAVVRTRRSGRLSASLAGGLTWFRLSGDAQPLGFTEYTLGGHSVLFSNDARLAFALEPTDTLGFNVGGDLSIAFSSHVGLLVGYRYLGSKSLDVPIRLTSVVNADQIVLNETLPQVAQQMQPAPVRLDPSGSRVVVGLKVGR